MKLIKILTDSIFVRIYIVEGICKEKRGKAKGEEEAKQDGGADGWGDENKIK